MTSPKQRPSAPNAASKAQTERLTQLRRVVREAAAAGDWEHAVEACQSALRLAPFSVEWRQDYETALYEAVVAREEAKRGRSSTAGAPTGRPAARTIDPLDGVQAAAPRPRPRRPARQPWTIPAGVRLAAVLVVALALTGGSLYAISAGTSALSRWVGEGANGPLQIVTLPPDLEQSLADASVALKAGEPARAITTLRAALEKHPEHKATVEPALARALRVEAGTHQRARRFDRAAVLFEEATRLDSDNVDNWIDLGLVRLEDARTRTASSQLTRKRELLSDAEKAFREAIARQEDSPVALLGLAESLALANDRRQAADTYERIVQVAAQSPEAEKARRALTQLRKR
jgi:tetratricopeptide (TPR) repeat protein